MIDQSLAQPAREHVPESEAAEDLEPIGSIVPRALRSTRQIRCDHEFLGLLNEDFGIDFYSLNQAFMGVPSAPKKRAIALCEWAARAGDGDPDEAGKALRAWAKKNAKGLYDRRLIEAPETTYEDNEHLRSIGRL